MLQLNCGRVPTTAQSLGLGESFRYWRGASGRKYLFSLVRDSDLDDLQDVVLIEAGLNGAEPAPTWLGEVNAEGDRVGVQVGVSGDRRRHYVHFLAGSFTERRDILNDLLAAAPERAA